MFDKSFRAGEDLKANRFATLYYSETAVMADNTTTGLIGATGELDVSEGGVVDLRFLGEAEVEAGGAITAGAVITPDSQGRAVAAASGDTCVGFALEDSTTAGQTIRVLMLPCAEAAQPTT